MENGVATILAHGKSPGVLATDESVAAAYLAQGARFVALGVDSLLLVEVTERLARRFKSNTPKSGNASPY